MSETTILVRADPELADLIPGFLDNRRADLRRIEQLVAARDAGGLKRIGHDLKGCGSAYGFDPVSEAGAALEQAALRGEWDAAAAALARLGDYLARVEVRYD